MTISRQYNEIIINKWCYIYISITQKRYFNNIRALHRKRWLKWTSRNKSKPTKLYISWTWGTGHLIHQTIQKKQNCKSGRVAWDNIKSKKLIEKQKQSSDQV